MTSLIVEDELHSREFLKTLVTSYCEGVTVVGAAETVLEAIRLIDELHPDLVFLDIEMQSGTGFDVLQGVKSRAFDVVFTTAYDHYALQAIKFSAVDYLLKPIDIEELRGAVEKPYEDEIEGEFQRIADDFYQRRRDFFAEKNRIIQQWWLQQSSAALRSRSAVDE